ncbi:MAG TPA: SDR family oxidoreductase [Solirubrobacteraceae bacterium]|nr:SDR family oxidoreductase [Solirubrobacteraceae bacterium]
MTGPDTFSLTGRVAVVTGGGGWLGADVCACLASAGAAVAVVGRTTETIEAAASAVTARGGRAVAVRCDISDAASVTAMTRDVADRLGPVDVLVNNAAIYPERPWTEISEDEWDRVLATNLKAFFLCARAAYPGMSDRGYGRIINLTSTTFFYGFPNATVLDYVTSKGGIIGFTRALSREIGPTGITVNAIAPGAFEPPPYDEDYNRWVLDRQSLKRRGVGSDVGNTAVFLASEAAAFITGQTIAVDGGMVTN